MRTTFALTLVSLVGCAPAPFEPKGTQVWKMFPFDGARTWEFINVDATVTYKLVGAMTSAEPEVVGGTNIYTVMYTKDCVGADDTCIDGDLVRTLRMSSDDIDGVQIHGFAQGGVDLTFAPPILFTDTEADLADKQETASAGFNWTSTFLAFEDCPVRMQVEWNCAHFHLSDGDSDPLSNAGLVGDYYVIETAGMVGLNLDGEPDLWELSRMDCEGECNGNW